MWILLNGKPLNVLDILNVSEIIKVDSIFLLENNEKLSAKCIDAIPIENLPPYVFKMDFIKENAESKNSVWGYMFYLTAMEHKFNREDRLYRIFSDLYPSEDAVKRAIKNLLSHINKVCSDLPAIEI